MKEFIFIYLFFTLIIIMFGFKHKYWVKNNKSLYGLLFISILGILGDHLPPYWELGAKHYDLIYNVSIAYIPTFIFYWITIAKKELDQEWYYSNRILVYCSNLFNLIAPIYYFEKYKKFNSNDHIENFTIDILIEDYLHIFKKNLSAIEEEGDKFCKRIEDKQKNLNKNIKDFKEMNSDLDKRFLDVYKRLLDTVVEDDSYYKDYLKFCNKSRDFKGFLDSSRNNFNTNEIDEIESVFNILSSYTNETKDGYEYLLKNIPRIHTRIENLTSKKIEFLKYYKKYIPKIRIEFDIFKFGRVGEELKHELINDFYHDVLEGFVFDFVDYSEKEYRIKSYDKGCFIVENGDEYFLKDLTSITRGEKILLLFNRN